MRDPLADKWNGPNGVNNIVGEATDLGLPLYRGRDVSWLVKTLAVACVEGNLTIFELSKYLDRGQSTILGVSGVYVSDHGYKFRGNPTTSRLNNWPRARAGNCLL